MRLSLTPAQAQLFAYIKARLAASPVAPSFDEMMAAMGLASKSGIHRLVTALEHRGWIVREHSRSRAIRLRQEGEPAPIKPAAAKPAPRPIAPPEEKPAQQVMPVPEMMRCPRCTMTFYTSRKNAIGRPPERLVCPDCGVAFLASDRGPTCRVTLKHPQHAQELWGLV